MIKMELKEPSTSLSTVQYHPDGHDMYENPPRFIFMPQGQADIRYTIEVCKSEDFLTDVLIYNGISTNFYTPDRPIPEGDYFWRYKIEHQREYSKIRKFSIGGGLPETPLAGRDERFASLDRAHPRLWMNNKQVDAFKAALKNDPNFSRFNEFCKHSVTPCFEHDFPVEPEFFWGRTVNYGPWSFNWKACHDAMLIIRNLAFAGTILDNENYILKAKQSLLAIAKWDPHGSTSRYFHDECTFRVIYGLAFGYDWLYCHLTEAERKEVLKALFIRTKCVADHTQYEQRLHVYPYNSHSIRSLSSVMIPACICMLFEQSEAEEWLHYAIEYLSGLYPPWGGKEGGWSEGSIYWTSATSYILSAMDNLKSFCGIDLFKRPFFHQTANFPLYCHPHDTYGCGFSDGTYDDKPGFKTAINVQQFGAITGNPQFQWYYDKCMERLGPYPEPFQQFYDDMFFLDVMFAYRYKPVVASAPTNGRIVKWFKDVGWAAVNLNIADDDEHIMLLVKSSPFGSVSHSHADQNSFTLFAYGQPLLINAGYYTSKNAGYASPMHCYTRETYAHNNILIDGKGQMADLRQNERRREAKGNIVSVTESSQYVKIRADASEAYRTMFLI